MHSNHSEGLIDFLRHRWHFASAGPKLDVVCSGYAASPVGFTVSCRKFVANIGDAFVQSGEVAQRRAADARRLEGGGARRGECRDLRGEERTAGGLVVGRRQGERDPLDPYRGLP
jgi:hypothetical protein